MKRPRLKKWAKWTCTLAAGAAAGLAGFSGLYVVTSSSYNSWTHEYRHCALGGGALWVYWADCPSAPTTFVGEGWSIERRAPWTWNFWLLTPVARPTPRGRWGLDFELFNPGFEAGISLLYPILL